MRPWSLRNNRSGLILWQFQHHKAWSRFLWANICQLVPGLQVKVAKLVELLCWIINHRSSLSTWISLGVMSVYSRKSNYKEFLCFYLCFIVVSIVFHVVGFLSNYILLVFARYNNCILSSCPKYIIRQCLVGFKKIYILLSSQQSDVLKILQSSVVPLLLLFIFADFEAHNGFIMVIFVHMSYFHLTPWYFCVTLRMRENGM